VTLNLGKLIKAKYRKENSKVQNSSNNNLEYFIKFKMMYFFQYVFIFNVF